MKKTFLVLIFIIFPIFVFSIKPSNTVTIEIYKQEQPIENYKIEVLEGQGGSYLEDTAVDYYTDKNGRLLLHLDKLSSKNSYVRIWHNNENIKECYSIGLLNYIDQTLRFNIIEKIDYFQDNRVISWNRVKNASTYQIEGFRFKDSEPREITADFVKLSRVSKNVEKYQYINKILDTGNPVFSMKGNISEFIIPRGIENLKQVGIIISAYDDLGELIAKTPVFLPLRNYFLENNQIRIEFSAWNKSITDFEFYLGYLNDEGKAITKQTINTGDKDHYILEKDPNWLENIIIIIPVYMWNSNGDRIKKYFTVSDEWGKIIRINLQSPINLELSNNSISWEETLFAEQYKISFYLYKKAEKKAANPNYIQYDVVDDPSIPFEPENFTTYSNLIENSNPLKEITISKPEEFNWPKDLSLLSLYGIVVRAYDNNNNIVGISRLTPWPAASPVIEWDNSHFQKDAAALALSGIMMKLHKTNFDSLPIYPITHQKYHSIKDGSLGNDWGIHSGDDLRSQLENLKNRGNSANLKSVLNAINNYPQEPIWKAALKEGLTISQLKRMFTVKRLNTLFDQRLLHAWDWGRAIYIIRWSFTLGYIEEKEAWDLIYQFQDLIQNEYYSWEDFGQAYILGRFYWSSGRGTEIEKTETALSCFKSLFDDNKSPWNGFWSESEINVPTSSLDFEKVLNLTKEEKLFNWIFETEKVLRDYPELYKEYANQAPEGWQSFPQIREMFLIYSEKAGELEKEKDMLLKSINDFPQYYPFIQQLSRLKEKNNNYAEALATFDLMEEWALELPENLYLRSRLHYLQHEWDQALKLIELPLKEENEDDWYYYNAHYITGIINLDQGNYVDALQHIKIVYNNSPEKPLNKYYYAVSLLLCKKNTPNYIEKLLKQAETEGNIEIPSWLWDKLDEFKKDSDAIKLY